MADANVDVVHLHLAGAWLYPFISSTPSRSTDNVATLHQASPSNSSTVKALLVPVESLRRNRRGSPTDRTVENDDRWVVLLDAPGGCVLA